MMALHYKVWICESKSGLAFALTDPLTKGGLRFCDGIRDDS